MPRALYAAVEPVHLRSSFDVLFAIARDQLGLDVLRSGIVLYFNKDRSRCKLLFHDGSGFVILYKRLDRGHFARLASVSPDSNVCACCGATMVDIGEETREIVERQPVRYQRTTTHRHKLACNQCKGSGVVIALPEDPPASGAGPVGTSL